MQYLFLVSIGPVQEFIASARRTRDLHFGSWFLSELSRAAAQAINAQQGASLIFPAPENEKWLQSGHEFMVANRILARVGQDPGELAKLVRTAVFQRLHEIRDQAYHAMRDKKTGISFLGDRQAIAYRQIDDLVELVWVALPYEGKRYHHVRVQVETLMAARKNTADFQRVAWGEEVPKSSLDGQLESVIPENAYPPRTASPAVKRDMLQRLYHRYGIAGQAERLSGVDLLKRAGSTAFERHFPSTSHMAVLPFLQRMQRIDASAKPQLHKKWDVYVNELNDLALFPTRGPVASNHPILGHHDGALLFESRLPDVLGIPSTDGTSNKEILQAQDALQTFYHALDEQFSKVKLGRTRPSTYYALLQADGDSMGELIDALAEQGYEQHRMLSQALSRFAASVRTIVEKHQGALIYSGGDDVLALLPLHTILACAVALKTRFSDALKDLAVHVDRQPPTLSMGIAIVHHLDSLREARRLAHRAEQQAKQVDGKNALAIIVSKRGGEDYAVVGKWDNIDIRLSQLLMYCRAASLPVGMAYELRDLNLRLSVPTTDPQYETLQEVIRLDTLRILLRKLTVPAGKLSPEKTEEIETFLRDQLDLPPKEQKGSQNTTQVALLEKKDAQKSTAQVSLKTFINELVIAQMLAEAQELADPGKGEKV
jgi:CRISPR-associated protein Cmr2